MSAEAAALTRRSIALDKLLEGEWGPPYVALDVAYGRIGDPDPALDQLAQAAAIARSANFFHWELAFPNVWQNIHSTAPDGGFDAVIGNPPWDKMRFEKVPWLEPRMPEIARAPTSSARRKLIDALRKNGNPLYAEFSKARDFAEQAMRMARLTPALQPLAGGDTNLYALFVGQAERLLAPGGVCGLLVPTEIATGLAAAPNFRALAEANLLRSVLDFQNRLTGEKSQYFPDVYYREKFCAYVFGGTARTIDTIECAYFLRGTTDDLIAEQSTLMTAADFRLVNPNTGTAPVFRTANDARLTRRTYATLPVLADRSGTAVKRALAIDYATSFHMANDSDQFATAAELIADGCYPVAGGRWRKGAADWLPLYEGKVVQAFNHRAASIRREEANLHRVAQPEAATDAQLADPAWSPITQFYVAAAPTLEHWSVAIKDVTSITNARTVIAAIVPSRAAGHTLPLLDTPATRVSSRFCRGGGVVLDPDGWADADPSSDPRCFYSRAS